MTMSINNKNDNEDNYELIKEGCDKDKAIALKNQEIGFLKKEKDTQKEFFEKEKQLIETKTKLLFLQPSQLQTYQLPQSENQLLDNKIEKNVTEFKNPPDDSNLK